MERYESPIKGDKGGSPITLAYDLRRRTELKSSVASRGSRTIGSSRKKILIFSAAILGCWSLPSGSSFVTQPVNHKSNRAVVNVVEALHAKPPPASIFDLDSIEAFEAELEKKAQEAAAQEESLENYIDDDFLPANESDSSTLEKKRYQVTPELSGKRIDAAMVALEPDFTRSVCGSLVTDGLVAIVGGESETSMREVIKRKSFKVEEGQWLEVQMPQEKTPTEIVPQKIPLDIMYEDEHMIVINKAANMVVHPAAGNWDGTIVNALAYYLAHDSPFGPGEFHSSDGTKSTFDEAGEATYFRPGVVHRLDKGTTGALVLAKTNAALAALSEAFAQRTVKKTYLAITVGNPGKRVVIDKHIERHPINRQKMRVVPDPHKSSNGSRARNAYIDPLAPQRGRRALSMVDTISFDGKLALVQVRIETGRTREFYMLASFLNLQFIPLNRTLLLQIKSVSICRTVTLQYMGTMFTACQTGTSVSQTHTKSNDPCFTHFASRSIIQ